MLNCKKAFFVTNLLYWKDLSESFVIIRYLKYKGFRKNCSGSRKKSASNAADGSYILALLFLQIVKTTANLSGLCLRPERCGVNNVFIFIFFIICSVFQLFVLFAPLQSFLSWKQFFKCYCTWISLPWVCNTQKKRSLLRYRFEFIENFFIFFTLRNLLWIIVQDNDNISKQIVYIGTK